MTMTMKMKMKMMDSEWHSALALLHLESSSSSSSSSASPATVPAMMDNDIFRQIGTRVTLPPPPPSCTRSCLLGSHNRGSTHGPAHTHAHTHIPSIHPFVHSIIHSMADPLSLPLPAVGKRETRSAAACLPASPETIRSPGRRLGTGSPRQPGVHGHLHAGTATIQAHDPPASIYTSTTSGHMSQSTVVGFSVMVDIN
jgi:hypothetical protein